MVRMRIGTSPPNARRGSASVSWKSRIRQVRSLGPGTEEWLSASVANRVPSVGRIALTPMLNERAAHRRFTMCRAAQDRVFSSHVCR